MFGLDLLASFVYLLKPSLRISTILDLVF